MKPLSYLLKHLWSRRQPMNEQPIKLVWAGIRYPAGVNNFPIISFHEEGNVSKRHMFQAGSVNMNWFKFITNVNHNAQPTDASKTYFSFHGMPECYIIDLTYPEYYSTPVERLKEWLANTHTESLN